jgi:hypothetical protein
MRFYNEHHKYYGGMNLHARRKCALNVIVHRGALDQGGVLYAKTVVNKGPGGQSQGSPGHDQGIALPVGLNIRTRNINRVRCFGVPK